MFNETLETKCKWSDIYVEATTVLYAWLLKDKRYLNLQNV